MRPGSRSIVLHVSPHPDDEIVPAGATLTALRDAGHTVLNLAVSLGRPDVRERRRGELKEACARADFALRLAEPLVEISRHDDLVAAERTLTAVVGGLLSETDPGLVVSPSPHDGHHGHEVVGRAVREALRGHGSPPPWWLWGLWADLPLPTLLFPFGGARLRRVMHVLEAYAGELERNDYRRLVRGRGMANAILGPERVSGYGVAGRFEGYAELLTEVVRRDGGWYLGTPREIDPSQDVDAHATVAVDAWIDSPSLSQSLGDGPSDRRVSPPGPGRSRRTR